MGREIKGWQGRSAERGAASGERCEARLLGVARSEAVAAVAVGAAPVAGLHLDRSGLRTPSNCLVTGLNWPTAALPRTAATAVTPPTLSSYF